MMFEPSLTGSIDFAIAPDHTKDNHLYENILGGEKWMVQSKPDKNQCSKSLVNNHIEILSSLTLPSSSTQISTISSEYKSTTIKYVYRRRKPQTQYVLAWRCHTPLHIESSGISSAVTAEANSVAVREENVVSQSEHKNNVNGVTEMPSRVSNIGPLTINPEAFLRLEAPEVLGSQEVVNVNRNLSGNIDTCSSSKSNLDNGVDLNIIVSDAPECSSGFLLGMDTDVLEKNFCISFLRSHGLLGNGPDINSDVGENTSGLSSRICENTKCGVSEEKLLICDQCDRAFHAKCWYPRVTETPIDEWLCNSCQKKKMELLKEMYSQKLQKLSGGALCSIEAPDDELSPLQVMLLGTEPHKTEVRVGKGFQADVPEWSAPQPSETRFFGEPLERALQESERLHNSRPDSPRRVCPIGNWLQCREVVRGLRPDLDGGVCGKWRRAPLFEVQNDEWNCFDAVLWNPAHADCAVPQELETKEIMKQLKYMEMLKPRLTGKRQRFRNQGGGPLDRRTNANKIRKL